MNTFDEARWRRVGASDEEIETLAAEFAALGAPEAAAQSAWMTSSSDGDLRLYLDARREAGWESTGDVEEPEAEQTAPEPETAEKTEHKSRRGHQAEDKPDEQQPAD